MLRLPAFDYLQPTTLDEAVALLAHHQGDAMLVAGGTDLYPSMKRRLFEPKVLIGLAGLEPLRRVEANGHLTLGAGVTLNQVASHQQIRQHYPALAHAAGEVSTPQLRRMGTIGGNLCVDTRCTYYNQTKLWRQALGYCMKKEGHICWVAPSSKRCWAVSSSDTAPVLIALGASVRLVGPEGERSIPVHALYQDDGMDHLTRRPGEIITQIELPPSQGLRMTYHKLRLRGAFDFPVLGVAVALHVDRQGICTDANIVLGAVASAPVRAVEAEAVLRGRSITAPDMEDRITEAADLACKWAKPLDNTDMGLSYRKQMTRVYVARALREVSHLDNRKTPLGETL